MTQAQRIGICRPGPASIITRFRFVEDDHIPLILMTDRTDDEWRIFINEKISQVLSPESNSNDAPPLASIKASSDPCFPLAIDHTLLKQDATPAQIDALCDEAIEYGFKVCEGYAIVSDDGPR